MTPYDILGVPYGSDVGVCKKAYRELCKVHHPDVGGDEQKFIQVQNAWKQISEGSFTPPRIKQKAVLTHNDLFSFSAVSL